LRGDEQVALFEVGGVSADADWALDRHRHRHRRNARTHASHDPAVLPARTLGDHPLSGTPLHAGPPLPPASR